MDTRKKPTSFHQQGKAASPPLDGRRRVIIKNVTPEIESGRFPVKRIVGDMVKVEADIFTDGHDALTCVLQYRKDTSRPDETPLAVEWQEAFLDFLGNDRWGGAFQVAQTGRYHYAISAWVDPFKTWRRDLVARLEAGQDVKVDLLVGARLLKEASIRAPAEDAPTMLAWADTLSTTSAIGTREHAVKATQDENLRLLMQRHSSREHATTYDKKLGVVVDQKNAQYGAWYEMFPRSQWTGETHESGTFKTCEARLAYIAALGFDILYLPPIHPIGQTHRKGKNNSTTAQPGDPGSPWAIGSDNGGHTSVHSELGTLDDFRSLVNKSAEYGIAIALDLAFQCSPDHPYVKQYPEFFRRRPDGQVQYAENPPKKYEDIYPFDFESAQWSTLWQELLNVVNFWIAQGVRIFRVDNPHTKPFPFWEWLITNVKHEHPDIIFLAEAFTRPKVVYHLAKLGFTQSYTYFSWRNTKSELTQYFTELTRTEVAEFFRPNLWPNTPDILTEYFQAGGPPAFMIRLALAATLGASYGIYGPAYELCENHPRESGGEEYLDSEKYEIKQWDIHDTRSLKDFITQINKIRRENAAFHSDSRLQFHDVDNDQLLCYSKSSDDLTNVVLTVVNLDPFHSHAGWTSLQLEALGVSPDQGFQAEDLLTGARYLWRGKRNFVEVNPATMPVQILRLRRYVRTERHFDYYM